MGKTAWWGTPERVSARLRLEVEMMRAAFGDTFRLVVPRCTATCTGSARSRSTCEAFRSGCIR
ncbi:MAG: hypothetical protein KatS3mg051_0245 [Anaerolineae bacterium]|nr:MAG: hypothetical protein KatS3mg051_0245 [Anaerolineae bacterium]